MAAVPTWIQFSDGSRMPLDALSELERAQYRLSRFYGLGVVHCLCNRGEALEIAICCLHLGGKVRYYLRPHPKSKHLHRVDCVFARGARTPEQIHHDRLETQRLRIEGGFHIREIAQGTRSANASRERQLVSPTEKPASVLGVLRILWERAGLHVFHPQKPTRRSVEAMTRLRDAADVETDVGTLRDVLVAVPAGGQPDDVAPLAELNSATIARAAEQRLRIVIVGELGDLLDIAADKRAARIKLKGLGPQLGWGIAWRREVAQSVVRRFEIARALLSDERARVLFVATAEPDATSKTLWVRYAALFPVSRIFIPIESSHELTLAAHLVGASRVFRKPLTLEADVLPDFELLDAGPYPLPMEVFGRRDDAYMARRAEKTRIYDARYGSQGWWWWDPLRDAIRIPALPPRC